MKSRELKILEILENKGRVDVSLLAEATKVSEATLRRDLVELTSQGIVDRDHGGARLTEQGRFQVAYQKRLTTNFDEKKRIGKAVSEMIMPGDSVLIDTGTTAMQFAEALAERDPANVTVVTNSLKALQALQATKNLEIFVLGGSFRSDRLATRGPLAEKALSQYAVTYTVIGVDGISIQDGLTTINAEAARLGSQMIECAEKTIVLTDHSKLGKRSFVEFGKINQVAHLVTSQGAPAEILKSIRDVGVTITEV